jgi:ABC-type lipoprotein export system ATPase subunit
MVTTIEVEQQVVKGTMSGEQEQRFALALALINDLRLPGRADHRS